MVLVNMRQDVEDEDDEEEGDGDGEEDPKVQARPLILCRLLLGFAGTCVGKNGVLNDAGLGTSSSSSSSRSFNDEFPVTAGNRRDSSDAEESSTN